MTYKNKGPPKRSEGVLQTGNCQILCNRVILIYKLPFSHCIFYKEKQLRSMQK